METDSVWRPAYVGLGSNLGDPPSQLRRAFEALKGLSNCCCHVFSSLYRSAPMGPADQPDFINAAAAFLTRHGPHELLHELKSFEDAHGRHRGAHWGPRTLDLDLLMLGKVMMDEPDLSLPHPGLAQRNFVLLPLAEIAPEVVVPGRGSVRKLLAELGDSGARIERVK